jgi:transposase
MTMNQIGIDVSNDVFDASMASSTGIVRRQFANTPAGYRCFIQWALRGSDGVRVCLEATGVYHLQLALALNCQPRLAVMVVNPCAARRFAQAQMVRAKTDGIDADGLLCFLQRMPFQAWVAPRDEVLQLQSLAHRMVQLDKEIGRERCRLHAARRAGPHTRVVQQDIQVHLKQLQRRLVTMRAQALRVIGQDTQLAEDAHLIDTVPGFAELSATRLVAELSALSPAMTAPQWVAQAGMDPRPNESGTSQRAPRRISKQGNGRIRAALFMPALVAVRHDEHVAAYYEMLLARGKPKMVALVAVMRRLLHALWGMLHHRQAWDGNKFYRLNQIATT